MKKPLKHQFLLLLILLAIASFLGNYFHLPLFFGVDFLFGSIPVLIAVYFYGAIWGALTAFFGSLYTYLAWGHPYSILIFTGEALFVGLVLGRKRQSIAIIDSAYWLLIGMPLVGLCYEKLVGLSNATAWLIAFKQAINGIFNGLIVNILVDFWANKHQKNP